MVKKLGRIYLNKKFSTSNLNSRVGQVNLRAKENGGIKSGAYRGLGLKKVMVDISQGMTRGLLKKKLMNYGITGSQLNKRQAIMRLAFGDENKSLVEDKEVIGSDGKPLTPEQIKKNLANRQFENMDAKSRVGTRYYAAGRVQVNARQPIEDNSYFAGGRNKKIMGTAKGAASDLIKPVETEYALGGKPTSNTAPRHESSKGTMPLGFERN